MNSRALYYPYINVPESTWISQQLLYHDCIGAIVPYEYLHNPDRLTPYMQDLVSSELVQQVIPSSHIIHDSTFDQNFLRILEQYSPRRNMESPVKIHIEKFGEGLKTKLKARGLLQQSACPWYFVERTTANLLMTYVASVICADTSLEMRPITNTPEYIDIFLDQESADEKIVLESIIPAPERPIPVSELVKFKEEYGHALSALRGRIKSNVERISIISDKEIRQYELSTLADEWKEEIDHISQRISERGWGRLNFVTLCSLTASVIPLVDAAQIASPEDLYKSIPGLAGAIASEYTSRRNKFKQLKSHDLAYAAYVKHVL